MKGQLLKDKHIYLPLMSSAPLSSHSLTVLLYLLHPFTGQAASFSLSSTPLTFGVGNCQPRHGSDTDTDTDTDMLVETAAEQ